MGLDIWCKCDGVEFRAGSYSGYNAWRETLAELAGIKNLEAWWKEQGSALNRKGETPFHELINFSDCEGKLPYKECVELLADFSLLNLKLSKIRWQKLETINSKKEWDWFKMKYYLWFNAFIHCVHKKCHIIFG